MKRKKILIILFLALSILTVSAQKKGQIQNNQTSFSMEEDVKNAVKIPAYVFNQIIKNDKESYSDGEQQNRLRKTLQAAFINLSDNENPDLIVIGDPGANIGGFWIFRSVNNRWQLMLVTRAHSLEILKTKTNGYYNISIAAMSAVTLWESIYKFNRKNYLAKDCYEMNMESKKPVKKYFRCPGPTEKPYR